VTEELTESLANNNQIQINSELQNTLTVKEEETNSSQSTETVNSAAVVVVDTFSNIIPDEFNSWNESWCVVNHKDFEYIWNQNCALELSHNSNGWYRFLINNKLCSMSSNGQPEQGAESDENLPIFFSKLLKA
jgi:hypothetical protein